MALELTLPPLPGTDEVTIARWLKQPGDVLQAAEKLLEAYSDRFDWDIPAATTGVLSEVRAPAGTRVKTGAVLALVAEPLTPARDGTTRPDASRTVSGDALTVPDLTTRAPNPVSRITPLAARVAAEHGIDPSFVQGTGPNGRVTKEDVLARLGVRAPVLAGPSPALERDLLVEPAPAWRVRAEQAARSRQTVPHVSSFVAVDMSGIRSRIEKQQRAWQSREGFALDELPFVVLATVAALRAVPLVNSVFAADGIALKHAYHIGITGTTLIRHAEAYNLVGIARRIHACPPADSPPATFTLDPRGMRTGALWFTALVAAGQAATLGIGAVQPRALVADERIVIRPVLYLSLSYDHRVVDGIVAGQFLSVLKRELERG